MQKSQPYIRQLAVLFVLISPAALSAASDLADAAAFSIPPKDLQHEASREAASATSPAVILVNDQHWVFRSDNTVERRQHFMYQVLDSSAIQAWSSVQERWEPWHEDRPVIRARVITADGIAHELDVKTLVDAPLGGNTPQTYADVKVLQGPLPAVEVGAVVEAELIDHFTPTLGSLAFQNYIAAKVPVRFSRMRAEYPESLPLRYAVSLCPELKEGKERRAGIVYLTLAFGSFKAFDEPDPLLPFDVPRVPSFAMSTGSSWNDLATRYGKIIDEQIAGAPVKELVAQAVKGGTNRLDSVERLVRTLHSEVRYTGVELGDAAIIPAKPADTLSRKYGDCKDKAVLLVAMLRAAGIPAYFALLDAGLEQDVSPQLPGMGVFNHAIVYVLGSAESGSPEIWIDATAEHMRVGSLPPADEGRLALIIRPETKLLTKIPESPSAANVSQTQYDYYLPDFGPARIVQSASGSGVYDNTLRDMFALLDNEEFRRQFEQQTQSQWNTKAAIKLTHTPFNDLSKAFQITTDIPDAKNLPVSETAATLTLPYGSVFADLPAFFATDDSKETSPKDPKAPRTAGFVLPVAFIGKLSCRAHIPKGFALKKLPEEQTVTLGPAVFKAHYALADQILTADFSFDTGKRNYSLEEGNALKKAILEFAKQPAPALTFEPIGQTLLEEGHLREGLDAFRLLADQHSAEAVNHVRLSRAYLLTGCGKEARQEAEIANQMAPAQLVTWRNPAFVYEHDLIGRQYKQGWEPAIVEKSLRNAQSLDADDLSIDVELAESFSYDAYGQQYVSLDRLAKAVEIFQSMGDDKVEQQGAQDTLLFDLAMLGKLDDLKTKLDRFGSNGTRKGYQVLLTTLRESAAKAASDLQASTSGDQLKQVFLDAAGMLAQAGKYSQEADLAEALGLGSQLFLPPADLRTTRRADLQTLPIDSPEDLVRSFVGAIRMPSENAETLSRFWSSLVPRAALHALIRNWHQVALASAATGISSPVVARDVYLSNGKAVVENNANSGFRVRLISKGNAFQMLVVRENGALKLLGNPGLPEWVARQALNDLEKGKPEVARQWLDWLRDGIKVRSEDDPLGGGVFPHVWNKGSTPRGAEIRYAAASLMASKDALPILKEALDSATDASIKAYYEVAYTGVCISVKSWTDCLPVAKSLAASYPTSHTAQLRLAQAQSGAGQIQEAERSLKAAIANNPDDLELKRVLIDCLLIAGQPKEAAKSAKQAAETTNSTAYDWNEFGWLSLIVGDTDEAKVHAVERAQGQPVPSFQHTIASMYAEIGKVNEARRIALQTLYDQTPDSDWSYVFGRIAEQLGAKSSAILHYENVEPPAGVDDLVPTYLLAQKRLAILHANSARAQGK